MSQPCYQLVFIVVLAIGYFVQEQLLINLLSCILYTEIHLYTEQIKEDNLF